MENTNFFYKNNKKLYFVIVLETCVKMRKQFNFRSKRTWKNPEKSSEKVIFFIFFQNNKTQSVEKNVFNFYFVKEAWYIYIMCSLIAQKKAPQTLKMGQKQGINSVKRQISLPDEKRLKKHCLSGKNQT